MLIIAKLAVAGLVLTGVVAPAPQVTTVPVTSIVEVQGAGGVLAGE